jgi:hypothetical protein
MKLRHNGVLALVGWYLMIPPIGNDLKTGRGVYVNWAAPISGWKTEGVYDYAAECTKAQAGLYEDFMKNHNMTSDREKAIVSQAFANDQCIASDDPRLVPSNLGQY